jgi:hypothetical protein
VTIERGACPPHHWQVTSRRIERTLYYHHRCVECAAEKDVPGGRTPLARYTWARARTSGAEPTLLSNRPPGA